MDKTTFNSDLLAFLQQSPTPFHAVASMVDRLQQHGFSELEETASWRELDSGRYYVTRNDSAIIAFNLPSKDLRYKGFKMVGAHTDSPCLKVKPNPERVKSGLLQLGVETYGGVLLNPWFDRDLSLAGRVSFRQTDGTMNSCLVDFKQALATIPSLAIHLDREANKDRTINAQLHLPPVLMQADEGEQPDFRALLGEQIRLQHPAVEFDKVLDYEMSFYDTQAPALIGLQQDFISSARLDNLLSCFTGLQALLAANSEQATLLVCNDHEEVGSASTSGAQGPFLSAVLKRLCNDEEDFQRMIQHSMMISADNAHAVHPNYADKHDAQHSPLLNAGPVIKTNSNQRYATNSETSALIRHLAEQVEVPLQDFVARTDMGCGSTIGPITATALGVNTLDIGVPTFAMHSIRELAGSEDAYWLNKLMINYYNHQN